MEILKILFTVLAITLFKSLTWIQIFILGMIINLIHYFYTNQENIKKNIIELNSKLNFTNGVLIICYGIPLLAIDLGLYIIKFLRSIWNIFMKTSVGIQVYKYLELADKYISNKKNEMKSNVFNMMMNNAMSELQTPPVDSNNNNNKPNFPNMPFGPMPDINNLLKDPSKINEMMMNFNNLMSNMNKTPRKISTDSVSSEVTIDNDKPIMNDDLFNQINEYMDDDTDNETDNKETDNKENLKNTILKTKKINKKIRKRKKNQVSKDEFNDMKNMTLALEEVLSKLKEKDN
jgi:hypothetical protein